MAVFVVFIALLITMVSAQDHLWMVQTVTRGYCHTHNCPNANNINNNVIIHGLWPVNSNGRTITWCPNQYPDIEQRIDQFSSELQSYMNTNWPSLSYSQNSDFWIHEWETHGTCQSNDPNWYFSTGGYLYYWTALSAAFSAFLQPNALYFESYIRSIVSGQVGGKEIILRCAYSGTDYYLTEVIVCVYMNGSTYMDCDKPRERAYDNCQGAIFYL